MERFITTEERQSRALAILFRALTKMCDTSSGSMCEYFATRDTEKFHKEMSAELESARAAIINADKWLCS